MKKSEVSKKTRAKSVRPKPERKRMASQPDAPSDAGLELTAHEEGGSWVWRQPSALNGHNPEGLSLAAIDMELDAAFGPQSDAEKLVRQQTEELMRDVHARQAPQEQGTGAKIAGKGRGRSGRLPLVDGARNIDMPQMERLLAAPTAMYLVRDSDAALVDLIKTAPLALLQSLDAQDALARWTYAASWSLNPTVRNQAKDYLKACLPRRQGNPGKVRPHYAKLLRAYDDLCLYVERVSLAGSILQDSKKLKDQFQDLSKLEPHLPNDNLPEYTLKELVTHGFTRPIPSDVAANYIAAYAGISASRVDDLISDARAKQRNPESA